MPDCTILPHYQLTHPPIALEDFPQINITEAKTSKSETIDDYMMYDKYRDYTSGTSLLEEIFF